MRSSHRGSRRTAWSLAFAKGVGLWCVLVLSGCPEGCTRRGDVSAQTPPRLRFGLTSAPTTLCPSLAESAVDHEVASLVLRSLVQRTPTGMVPDLAVRVPTGDDVRTDPEGQVHVRWQLRPAMWSDGRPITSADVIAGWRVQRSASLPITGGADTARAISHIDVVDDHTFEVVWQAPRLEIAGPRLHPVLPAHRVLDAGGEPRPIDRDGFCQRPTASGPFMVKDVIDGASWRLVRNPHASPAPGLHEVVIRIYPSTEGLTSALVAGEIDATFPNAGLSPTEAARLVADHPRRFRAHQAPGTTWVHLDFNLDDDWLQDLRLRRAIAQAIDRRTLVSAVAGPGFIVDEGFLPRTHSAWQPLPPIPFDPAAASTLLDEAGWRLGDDGLRHRGDAVLRLQLASSSGQRDTERLLVLVQQALRGIGVDVVLDLKPFKVFFGEGARKRRLPHLSFYAWVVDEDATGLALWGTDRIPSADNGFQGKNLPGWRDAEVDRLVHVADAATDVATRDDALHRVQQRLLEDLPSLSFYFRPAVAVARSEVEGLSPTGTASMLGWNASQWRLDPARPPGG